jgi:LysM repeat protein
MTMKVHPARAIVLAACCSSAGWWLASSAGAEAAIASLDSLVAAAVLLAGAGAAFGVALLTIAALAESLLGWRPRAIGALPAPPRSFLAGSLGVALAAGIAVPASADEAYPGWAPAVSPSSPSGPTLSSPTPSPSPSAVVVASPVPTVALSPAPAAPTTTVPEAPVPTVELHAESAAPPVAEHVHVGTHVVVRGESLWRIAAELLGPDASNAQIARAWPLIYQANRATIGDDPSLILPGQELTIPQEVAA